MNELCQVFCTARRLLLLLDHSCHRFVPSQGRLFVGEFHHAHSRYDPRDSKCVCGSHVSHSVGQRIYVQGRATFTQSYQISTHFQQRELYLMVSHFNCYHAVRHGLEFQR